MISVDDAVKELFKKNYRQVARLTIKRKDSQGHDLPDTILTEHDICQGGLTVDRYSITGSGLEVGTAIAAQLNLKLYLPNKSYSRGYLEDAEIFVEVGNTDRSFGTLLGEKITRRHPEGLADDTIYVKCTGSGGQSFGAFIPRGLTLDLTGDSNDYFGKGLSGGKLVLRSPKDAAYDPGKNAAYDPGKNIIVGNVALYGATSGEAYIAGMAGERFCIRNSGAACVVEGVGEHGCEYMTGGCVVVLGSVGKNFAAGMSGGTAYVLDEENRLYRNLNKQLVEMESVEMKTDRTQLRKMIEAHVQHTGSERGQITGRSSG